MIKFGIILVLFSSEIRSQIPYFGTCPQVSVQENFDLTKYMGKWYEAYKYFIIFELFGKCIEADYSVNDNGTVTVRNTEIIEFIERKTDIVGIARASGSVEKAKLIVKFSVFGFKVDAPYWVLETDYDSYAVILSCTDLLLINTRFVWILTRERAPPDTVIQKAYDVLDKLKISKTFLMRTNQSNCPAPK
ncbi:hypothetical protein WA026_003032 [Henosepilachna vigintioctopunctata]|uniref:Apolipoprotein D n=1 Tax=Henosepilachna vigintioctopunctata TaxID=420089 RepID=A0AAW1TL81_9CUCU